MDENLLPKHGGYRNLKSFQVSRLVYDITVLFVKKYVDRFSRTKDQMTQAARSGVQNIAEGSVDSATSKKFELKLTQVARGSLEELLLDYEDYLRQNNLITLDYKHPVLMRLKDLKPKTLDEFRGWVAREHEISKEHGQQNNSSVSVSASPCSSESSQRPCPSVLSSACLVANGALTLLNLANNLLDKQVQSLGKDFEENGGFTERMYRVRSQKRGGYKR